MSVTIASRQRTRRVNGRLLKQIANALLADLKIADAELHIHLIAAGEMTRLNERFLRHAGPTDVITFDYTNLHERGAPSTASASFKIVAPTRRDGARRSLSVRRSRAQTSENSLPAGCAPEMLRPAMHADVFICVDEASRQARRFRTTWQSEIARYLVHGILHVCGLDDTHAGARRKMKREEERWLRELSLRFPLSKL